MPLELTVEFFEFLCVNLYNNIIIDADSSLSDSLINLSLMMSTNLINLINDKLLELIILKVYIFILKNVCASNL